MPSRRTHTKSRHGCLQCKAAHIKCDQGSPSCGSCQRKQKPCSYAQPATVFVYSLERTSSRDRAPACEHGSDHKILSPIPTSTAQCTDQRSPSHQSSSPPNANFTPPIEYEDLELLYHYLFSTHITLAHQHGLQQMWRTTIPQIAFKYPILMHSILSISALHLAHLYPSRKPACISSAIRHHDIALTTLRNALNHITPSNISALFACSTLIIVYVFAFPLVSPSFSIGVNTPQILHPVQEILKVFSLLHGTQVFSPLWSWLEAGEISLLFKNVDSTVNSGMSDGACASFSRLQSYIDNESDEVSDLSPPRKQTYTAAIKSLKQLWNMVCVPDSNKGMVLSWPHMMESEYEKLLAERQPIALVILAHYAVLLDAFKEYWWLRGWGKQLILDVERSIGGDERWMNLMLWPLGMAAEHGDS